MECIHELAFRREVQASDEHLMLTNDLQLHLEPLQHHLQTLLSSSLKHSTRVGVLPTFRKSSSSSEILHNTTSYNLVDGHMPMAWP
jgi:hypothetical protein